MIGMIKRNSRNIGKIVTIHIKGKGWGTVFEGRIGKVLGFRGDFDKGDPWVTVFVYNLKDKGGSAYPFAGHMLTEVKRDNK